MAGIQMRSFNIVCGLFFHLGWVMLTSSLIWGQDSNSRDSNWPNWRGPNSDGVAVGAAPPLIWSESENVKWKIEVPGKGNATPVIWDDAVIVLTAIPADAKSEKPSITESEQRGNPSGRGGQRQNLVSHKFAVIAYARETGAQKWITVVHEAVPHETGHQTNTFASASPITNGKYIFASFGSFGVYCLDMKGNVIWSKMLGQMLTRNSFGEGASPALHGETLVVPWDHEGQSSVFGLNTRDGSVIWETKRDEPTTWATPLITEYDGVTQVIMNGTNKVCSYDLSDGSLLWECGGQVTNPIPTPIRDGHHVLVMTGYRGFAIQSIALNSKGDVTNTKQVRWTRNDAAPYVASGVLIENRLYITKSRDPILSILNAETGEVLVDQKRLPKLDGL